MRQVTSEVLAGQESVAINNEPLAQPSQEVSVHLLHGLVGGSDLSLSFLGLCGSILAVEDSLSVRRELKLRDLHVGRVNSDRNVCAVGLLAHDFIDVDDPLESVAGCHLPFTPFELTSSPLDTYLVVLANGH